MLYMQTDSNVGRTFDLVTKVEVANFEQLLIPNTAFPEPRN